MSGIEFQYFTESFQNFITRIMPVGVVDGFKLIQISLHDAKMEVVPDRATQLPGAPLLDGAAVGETGKRIRKRQLLEEAVLIFKVTVERHNPLAYICPGH